MLVVLQDSIWLESSARIHGQHRNLCVHMTRAESLGCAMDMMCMGFRQKLNSVAVLTLLPSGPRDVNEFRKKEVFVLYLDVFKNLHKQCVT